MGNKNKIVVFATEQSTKCWLGSRAGNSPGDVAEAYEQMLLSLKSCYRAARPIVTPDLASEK